MPRQFGRRGRGKFAANSNGPLNFRENGCEIKQQHADWREKKRLRLLGKKRSGCQRAAGPIAVARAGSALGMFLRAAILLAEQPRRINQTARSRWQPNERQHQRNHCLDTLHGKAIPRRQGRSNPDPLEQQTLNSLTTVFCSSNHLNVRATTGNEISSGSCSSSLPASARRWRAAFGLNCWTC